MSMLKTLGTAIDMTATGALAAVELGATPFFPGANAILRLSAPIGGAGVITLQGSVDGTTDWYTVRTLNAAAGANVEVENLPPFIRINKTTVGTGTIASAVLEGVQ